MIGPPPAPSQDLRPQCCSASATQADMETVTTTYQSSVAGNTDVGSSSMQCGHDNTPQPNKLSAIAEVARRQLLKAGAFGSPVRRSSRLSCLPPPQPPEDTLDTLEETSADDSDGINDVVLQLSREETPEDDSLPDEPSTVLVSRIMRAHDNPSPPPQDLAHPGTNYTPGRDGQFPLLDMSVPPSPFRAINLLERLNQLSEPSFDSSSRPWTPDSVDEPAKVSVDVVQHGRKSPTLSAMPVPSEGVHAINAPSTPSLLKDILSTSSQLISEPANWDGAGKDNPPSELLGGTHQATTMVNPVEPETCGVPSTLTVVRSSPVPSTPTVPAGCPEPYPRTQTPLYPLASHKGEGLSSEAEAYNPDGREGNGAGILPADNNVTSISNGGQGIPAEATSHERLQSLSPNSTKMLTGLFLPSQPTPSIEHVLADAMRSTHPPATPTRIPVQPAIHPDFSQTTVQRPVIAPTPVRAGSSLRKFTSPLKFLSDADDVTRTPAQRVPVQTALARGIPSVQRTIQLVSASDQSNIRRFSTIRAPVFSRPALDGPSRSPAKRVPVTELVVSPTRGEEVQSSATRRALRARSASVEPRPHGTVSVRSQSLETSATLSKPDDAGKSKESVFPMFPAFLRSGTKLPFPLVPVQKPSNDLPPSIPEENEPVTAENTESSATLGEVSDRAAKSQLKRPSASSRIPRIGSKPYARPPSKPPSKNGKSAVGAMVDTASTTAPAFRFASKSNEAGSNNNNVMPVQPVDVQRSARTLKRKRGGEAAAASQPVMIRQVVPGMLGRKYTPKPSHPVPPTKLRSESMELSPLKAPQPVKFRKVVDGMLSARYAPSKPNATQTPPSDSVPSSPSPLSDISSSSNEEPSKENSSSLQPLQTHDSNDRLDASPIPEDGPTADIDARDFCPSVQDTNSEEASERPRRTSRSRKPAQQQYVLDVFSANTTTRPLAARRKPQTRGDGDGFMGMSATALRVLTTSNTANNQQTVAVFATEVIRKPGLRPESPTIKMKTILQKKRDERDMRRKERAERRAQMIEVSGASDTEGNSGLGDQDSLGGQADDDENEGGVPQKSHHQGPGDEEDYETPDRPERNVEPLRFKGVAYKEAKSAKQVKWHRGLSTAVYLDELPSKRASLPKDIVGTRGCLAPTSKNLPLDPLGNLVDIENRPLPELVTEHVVVKKYLYDNDIEPEPIPQKVTRSKSKKSKS